MIDTSQIQRFESVLTDPARVVVKQDPRLLIARDGDLSIYYVPFESINRAARFALVGITPGPTQMINGGNEARRVLRDGDGHVASLTAAKRQAAFSGEPMRPNLIKQLTHWGFDRWLGLKSCDELFMSSGEHLINNTSLLKNAVFRGDDGYAGTPDMLSAPLLRELLHAYFVPELKALAGIPIFPLGPVVEKVMAMLVKEKVVAGDQVFPGLLHPSGNNTYRIKYLVGDRSGELPHATKVDGYDGGRARFRSQML